MLVEIWREKINNKDYAVGIDIAKALGYKKPNDAISRHWKGVVKHGVGVVTGFILQNMRL
jgi:prophage antirepressor-like protein